MAEVVHECMSCGHRQPRSESFCAKCGHLGLRDVEVPSLREQQLQLDLNTANADRDRLRKKIDAATLLLERAMKPTNRPELVREALEKLRG